jgi:hypothetical protein
MIAGKDCPAPDPTGRTGMNPPGCRQAGGGGFIPPLSPPRSPMGEASAVPLVMSPDSIFIPKTSPLRTHA